MTTEPTIAPDYRREDEQFEPQTAAEAFLMDRLTEARRQMVTATVVCDSCEEQLGKGDLPCGCDKAWPEVRYV